MISPDLSFLQRWQVIGYLGTLQFHSDNDQLPPLNVQVSSEQIRRAGDSSGEWLTYSGSLSGWRYSSLSEITAANVSQLCSEAGMPDRFWLEFSAVIPWLGGAESDEGLEIFGRPEGGIVIRLRENQVSRMLACVPMVSGRSAQRNRMRRLH